MYYTKCPLSRIGVQWRLVCWWMRLAIAWTGFNAISGLGWGLSTSQILFSTDMKLNRFEERSLRYCLCSDLCFLCLGLAMSEWSKSRQWSGWSWRTWAVFSFNFEYKKTWYCTSRNYYYIIRKFWYGSITRGEEGCKPWAWDECEEGWVLTSARFNWLK